MIDPIKATPYEIQVAGMNALMKELGPVGAIRFLWQFDSDHGDYSEDRHAWLDQLSVDDIIRMKPIAESSHIE